MTQQGFDNRIEISGISSNSQRADLGAVHPEDKFAKVALELRDHLSRSPVGREYQRVTISKSNGYYTLALKGIEPDKSFVVHGSDVPKLLSDTHRRLGPHFSASKEPPQKSATNIAGLKIPDVA